MRILLSLENKKNRRRLVEWLGSRYEVLQSESDQAFAQPFDLAIVDSIALDRTWEQVQARKRADEPVFLPFLLVTSRRDAGRVARHLWQTIDGLIVTPFEKPELLAWVESLLRARRLSQELKQRAVEAPCSNEARLRNLFEQASDAIFVISADNRFLDVNRRGLEMTGYTREELLQLGVADILAPEERPRLEVESAEMMAGKPHLAEWLHQRKDGSTFPAEVSARRLDDNTYLAIVRDLTETRRLEKALRESEERLRLALDAAHLGTFDWDIPHNRITWSRWHEELWGFKPGEFGGTYEAFAERVHPDDLPGINAEAARCIAAREPFMHEFRVVWPDGSVHWMMGRGQFSFDDSGKPLRMRGVVMEITDRKQAELSLRQSEQQLRKVLDGLGPHMFVGLLTPDGTLLEANQPALAAAGLTRDDVLGKPLEQTYWCAYSEEAQAQVREAIRRAAQGEAVRYDVQIRVGENEFIWIDFSLQPLRDETGRVVFLVPSANVITERKQAEEALRVQFCYFRQLFESAPVGIALLDPDGKVTEINKSFETMFQYSLDELRGRFLHEVIVPPDQVEEAHEFLMQAQRENVPHQQAVRKRKDGKTLDVIVVSHPIAISERLVGVYVIYVDTTERKCLKSNSVRRRRWKLWDGWPAGWLTTSTIC